LQVARMQANLEAAAQTYTANHPNLMQMKTEMANLQTMLAYAQEQLTKTQRTSRVDFEVR
jgi:hypothetical protein